MIRSLSPYYLSIPWVSPTTLLPCVSYTISIWVWQGSKVSRPAQPEYSITKNNSQELTSGSDDSVDIARMISDYIDVPPTSGSVTGVYDSNSTYWVQWSYKYTDVNGLEPTVEGETTKLFSRGYSYGFEGGNVETVTDAVLFQGSEFSADRSSLYALPIALSETISTEVSIDSLPSGQIAYFNTNATTDDSTKLSSVAWINLSETTTDDSVTLTVGGLQVATIYIEDECKYEPLDIFFVNKLGSEQTFTFFKEKTSRLSVESSEFESDRGQPSLGNHQFVRYNVQARGEFSVFTGFIDESNNETIQQLLLSEKIWSYNGTSFTPLNIKTKSQEWKTQLNDKLINYKIDFEYSYNEINSI